MKSKPQNLTLLIEDLKSEVTDSSVGADRSSEATLHLAPDDDEGIHLSGEECKLIFHSPATVRRMFEEIDSPEEASVSIHGLDLTQEVLDALERTFTSVDEV